MTETLAALCVFDHHLWASFEKLHSAWSSLDLEALDQILRALLRARGQTTIDEFKGEPNFSYKARKKDPNFHFGSCIEKNTDNRKEGGSTR